MEYGMDGLATYAWCFVLPLLLHDDDDDDDDDVFCHWLHDDDAVCYCIHC